MGYTNKVLIGILVCSFCFANISSVSGSIIHGPHYEVHVVNLMPNQTWIHCFSKDNELGFHYLQPKEDFHWDFHMNFFGRTQYFCHFWWGIKQAGFRVFKGFDMCGDYDYHLNVCRWEIRPDGFYYSTTAKNGHIKTKQQDWY